MGTEQLSGLNSGNAFLTIYYGSNPPPVLSGTPEPSTWILFGTGVGLLGLSVARKRNAVLIKAQEGLNPVRAASSGLLIGSELF
ncbi:MAG: PEP-CTERM sorting domain-containing protein [Leptospirales bacterium]